MKRRFLSLAALSCIFALGVSAAATPASAGVQPTPFRVAAGIENPLVLFGFNPQPEPPAIDFALTTSRDTASITSIGVNNPQTFELVFGISAENGARIVSPRLPGADYSQLTLTIDTGLQTLLAVFDFTTSSGGIASSLDDVSFNPQPEPPASALGPYNMYGLRMSFTSLSDATVTMSLQDENGQRLGLTAIPEPAAAVLFALGLAGLGASRQRRGRPVH